MAISEQALDEQPANSDHPVRRFDWRLSMCGAVGALIVVLPTLIFGNDIGTFLVTVLVLGAVALALLIVTALRIRRQALAVFSMLLIFCAVSWPLFKISNELRYAGRWLFRSAEYKSLVLAQPVAKTGELQHMEWDEWGFAGSGDTTVYLVYDPHDSMKQDAKLHSFGKFPGVSCNVSAIQRLEDHWYSVQYYVDDAWGYCN